MASADAASAAIVSAASAAFPSNQAFRDFMAGLSTRMPPDGTSTLLVRHLEKKIAGEVDADRRDRARDLARRAAAREFDDFKSPHAMPKATLRARLDACGYADLATNVIDGDYD